MIALAGDLVDAAEDLDVERVAHVAGDHAEQRAAAAAEPAGEQVRAVAEVGGDAEDAVARSTGGSAPRTHGR